MSFPPRYPVEDTKIIDLYFQRSDCAIRETQTKYGRMLRSISYGILHSREDAAECENDTYWRTWNTIPPQKPSVFSAFLSKITRNLSLDRYDQIHARKRGSGEIPVLLDELSECLPDAGSISSHMEEEELAKVLNTFLGKLKSDARNIFLRRYWFGDSVQAIAEYSGFTQSKVKMSLLRSRKELKEELEKAGYTV